jgi:hypothetical protein
MFGTILQQVTGYFDRRALISAFFPSLIFWGITVVSVMALELGWSASLEGWEELGATAQVLVLIAFFVWVASWAFLTINFRAALVRLYQGYWPDTKIVANLAKRRREYWQHCWDELGRRDRELEVQEIALRDELDAFAELRGSKEIEMVATKQTLSADAKQVGAELDEFLEKSETQLGPLNAEPPATSWLAEFGQELRNWWRRLGPYLQGIYGDPHDPWVQRRNRLSQITAQLDATIARQAGEVEEQRLKLSHDLFLYYPPARDDVMPTKLGNVLKSAEMYAWRRYRLDAVVIWSRLQPLLPKEFAEPFQSAQMYLDLMVTLSAFSLLFGLPLSLWIAVKSTIFVGSLILYLLTLGPLLLGLAFLRHRYIVRVLALVGLLVISTFTIMYIAPLAQLGFQVSLPTAIIQFEVLLSLVLGSILLSGLIYHSAIEAGLAYGEKVKAAFDLYRWKVLESLHLQLPPNLDDEHRIWEEVCMLLYRGFTPDPQHYRYVQQEHTKEAVSIPPPAVRLPVPVKALPAYYPIISDDIIEIDVPEVQVPADAARTREQLVGCCPLTVLPAIQPVRRSRVTDPMKLKDTSAVSIPATAAMALGGELEVGDIVDVMLVPPSGEAGGTPAPTVFDNILVLDVKLAPANLSDANEAREYPFVIVFALPLDYRLEFATAFAEQQVLIARKYQHLSGVQ